MSYTPKKKLIRGKVITEPDLRSHGAELSIDDLRMDVLAIGLFGLAVGALTLGSVQSGWIPARDEMAVDIICLVFGGIVQLLAGLVDIRYHEQLGGTALTMYGFYWTTVFSTKIVGAIQGFHFDDLVYLPLVVIYAIFSGVMIYLTGHKSKTLMLLHMVITTVFIIDIMLKNGHKVVEIAGYLHLVIGLIALYHAVATLTDKFVGRYILPLGTPVFHRKPIS